MFKPRQFHTIKKNTAKLKAEFANKFIEFIESNFAKIFFTTDLYNQIVKSHGHDSYENLQKFYDEWFENPTNKIEFLIIWANNPIANKNPMADVLLAIRKYILKNKLIEVQKDICKDELGFRIKDSCQEKINQKKALGIKTMKFKVFQRSPDLDNFGREGYRIINADGVAYEILKKQPWSIGQTIEVPMCNGDLQWQDLSIEIYERIYVPESVKNNVWSLLN